MNGGTSSTEIVNKSLTKNVFDKFKLVSVLNEDAQQKTIYLHGRSSNGNGEENDAIIILERTPFSTKDVNEIISPDTSMSVILENDIYTSTQLLPKPSAGALKSTLIFPATEKHISKYSAHETYMIRETFEDYQNITLPHIISSALSHQWLENVLSKKSESERIVYEDDNPETGFILIPDLKWDCKHLSNLYLCALVVRRDLKSIRDLRHEHIPLLENVRENGKAAIQQKYNFNSSKLRIYFHYQPSYYHLHIHFANIGYDSPSCALGKAHLLDDVVDNLKRNPDYYATATLPCILKDNDRLFEKFKIAKNL